jgi:hypothetical protein
MNMPLYKSASDMYTKYKAKYNPTVISTRFTDVQSVALSRAETGLAVPDGVRTAVRPLLDTAGIAGGTRATYLAFATKLKKHITRQTGNAADNIKTGLIAYFKTAYGLSETLLNSIATAIAGS